MRGTDSRWCRPVCDESGSPTSPAFKSVCVARKERRVTIPKWINLTTDPTLEDGMRLTNIGKIILAVVLLILLALAIWFGDSASETEEAKLARLTLLRQDAYMTAMDCSNTTSPELRFEDIYWSVQEGDVLKYVASDGIGYFGGYFSQRDSVIYLPSKNEEEWWVLVHESLHAIGFRGHPNFPFRVCGVMPDQNT